MLEPAGMVTVVKVCPLASTNVPLGDEVCRFTTTPPAGATAGTLLASSKATWITEEVTPAFNDSWAVVKLSFAGGGAVTVINWVADVRPDAEAVMVGVPAAESSNLKLALVEPAGMVKVVMAAPVRSRNALFVLVDARFTVSPPVPALMALPP